MIAKDKEQGKQLATQLVEAFSAGFGKFKGPSYDEAKVRQGFVNPFFNALGWDVAASARKVGPDVDVVFEDRDGTGRRPDYGFYAGGRLKFYVEVKKPAIALHENKEAIYQAKEYAWNARVPFCILTDFEEFLAFAGGTRPARDKPRTGLISTLDLTYGQYIDKWDLLWNTLSREAVQAGSIERFILDFYNRKAGDPFAARTASPVDTAFLDDLAKWRKSLAHELALRNHFASDQALTESVQRILDRIVFVRVCEARGVARGEPLRQAWRTWRDRGGALYPFIVQIFRGLDPQFNGGLFTRHPSEKLTIEKDDVLDSILAALYEDSPYRFDMMPVAILGSIYERFLGSTIRLTTGGRAKVEEKDEVRHAGGVYYTPSFVVEAIARKTLGPLTEGKSPADLMKLRVLDPACGSGSFLLGALDHLIAAHLAYYRAQGVSKNATAHVFEHEGELSLTLRRKKEILASCIFGVDKDPQAIEVAQMSLYLKLMEGEDEQSLARRETMELFRADRYLPSLANNLISGNSLVSSQDLHSENLLIEKDEDTAEIERINPFDWKSDKQGFGRVLAEGGFDAIIGNPPYIRIQEMQKWAPREVDVFKERYASAKSGNFDIYVLFVERCLDRELGLLNKKGRLGFILPHKFFQAKYGAGLRTLLAERKAVAEVVDFGDAQVFEGATTYTCLLFLTSSPSSTVALRSVEVGQTDLVSALDTALAAGAADIAASKLTGDTWDFRAGGGELADRLLNTRPTLKDVAKIFVGLQTSADRIYVILDGDLRKKLKGPFVREFLPGLGSSPDPYFCPGPFAKLIFPYKKVGAKYLLADLEELRDACAPMAKHLEQHREALLERADVDTKKWWGYCYRKNLDAFEEPKLIALVLADRARLFIDTQGLHFTGGGNGPYYGIRSESLDHRYLLAVINSRLLDWLLKQISTPFRGGFFSWSKRYLERLPIPVLDIKDEQQKATHDKLVDLANRLAALKAKRHGADSEHAVTVVDRQIDAAETELNEIVYWLFGLSAKEREQVETSYRKSDPTS